MYGYYADDRTNGYKLAGTATVNVTVPPPFFCPQFVLIGGGSMNLTHKYADAFPDITYPGKQTTDGEMPMKIKTVAAPAGTVVYLRVYDPPDESPYGTPHVKDDNIDGGAGTVNGTTRMTTVTLPANGSVPVVLKTTLFASGDNYEVAASASPSLHTPSQECDASIACQKQKVTTFKRFYVEPNEMYRNSQLIQSNILVGQRLVYINDRGYRRGDNVRLIHAPSYLRTTAGDAAGFYSEDFTIADIRRNPIATINAAFEVELSAGVANHYCTDLAIGGIQLGDALVNLTRNPQRSGDPMYRMNMNYIRNAFWFAYADLITLPSNGVGMPLYENMTDTAMIFAGAKWFAAKRSSLVPSNTGLAVAAATRAPLAAANQLSLGTTGGPYSYVWRENIDEATAGPRNRFPLTSGHNADLTSGEVLVHELAHQWNVNSGYVDHECTHNSYDNAALFCQGNGPQNSGQYDDGHVAFHYIKPTPTTPPAGADSEVHHDSQGVRAETAIAGAAMKRLLSIAFLTLLLAAGVAHADVRLILDENSILPGTPTGLTVLVTNPGKTALHLPPALWLVATTADVSTFRVSAYNVSDTAAITINAAERVVPPGETREFRFDPSPVLVGSPWFTDGRLSAPGTYRLRAVFAPDVEPGGEFNAANALASKEELLTVAAESPDDAAVWEWMRARGRGKWGQGEWMSEPFADFVMKNHPKSGYALYAAIFQPRDETAPSPALAEQAARFPQKSYSDQLRLVLVQYHQQAADILRHSNVQAAAEQAEAARKLAADLATRGRSASVRTTAQRLLTTIPKREAFLQQPQVQ